MSATSTKRGRQKSNRAAAARSDDKSDKDHNANGDSSNEDNEEGTPAATKRRRVAGVRDAFANGDEVERRTDAEESSNNRKGNKRRGNATEFEEDYDEHVSSQDAADGGTEIQETPAPRTDDDDTSTLGIIRCLILKNFMCHKFLQVDFGPHMNFVTGRNGSGKSAILTALTIALGGSATVTNRGSSLKDLIKHGESAAEIEVTLAHEGGEALPYLPGDHKRQRLGDVVKIVRRIASDGSTTMKVVNADGKTVSTKMNDMRHLVMDHLNINVSSPMTVLNQDASKEFLVQATPEKFFMLFLKATKLYDIMKDLQSTEDSLTDITTRKEVNKAALEGMLKEVQHWEEKYKDLNKVAEMKKELSEYENQFVWAKVAELEAKQNAIQDDVLRFQTGYDRLTKQYQAHEQKVLQHQAEAASVAGEQQAKQNQIQEVQILLEEVSRQRAVVMRGFNSQKMDLRNANRKYDESQKERTNIEGRIADLRRASMVDVDKQNSEREMHLNALEEKLRKAELQKGKNLQASEELEGNCNELMTQMREAENNLEEASNKIRAVKPHLLQLERSRKNRLAVFGNDVPTLIDTIKRNERKFRSLPIGPIGAHISVKNGSWTTAIEACISNYLFAWIVSCNEDQRVLAQMMKQTFKSQTPMIITRRPEPAFDVRMAKAQCEYPTLMDEITVDSDQVFNVLVDTSYIHQTCLCIKDNEAIHLINRKESNNVRYAFSQDGGKGVSGSSTHFLPNTSRRRQNILVADVESEITVLTTELDNLMSTQKLLQDNKAACQQELRQRQKLVSDTRRHKGKIANEIKKLHEQIHDLKQEETLEPVDVTQYDEDLDNTLKEIEDNFYRVEQIKASLEDNSKAQLEPINSQEQGLQSEYTARMEEYESYTQDVNDRKDATDRASKDLGKIRSRVDQCQRDLETHTKQLEVTTIYVNEETLKAEELVDRVDLPRGATCEKLNRKIMSWKKRIEEEEKQKGSADATTKAYHDKKTKYEDVSGEVQRLEKLHKKLKKGVQRRTAKLTMYKYLLVTRCSNIFDLSLSQRGFTGRLDVDYEEKRLDIIVQTSAEDERQNTKSLSGGERSFSTISFIIALWETMDAPWRALDEFDVFMDMLVRRLSMGMLIDFARKRLTRQFICVTPQDMTAIYREFGREYIHVSRLRDPVTDGQMRLSDYSTLE